jgi:putative nucleotidyltransferase with HDIG domain
MSERHGGWYRRVLGRFELWSLGLTLAASVTAAILINWGGELLTVREGQRLARAVVSRVSFELADEQQTILMRTRARESAPNVYVLDGSLLDRIRGRLTSALTLARTHADDRERVRTEAARQLVQLDDAALDHLLKLAAQADGDQFQRQIDQVVRVLVATPLVEYSEHAGRRSGLEAALVDPRGESEAVTLVKVGSLLFANNVENVTEVAAKACRLLDPPLRTSLQGSLLAMLRSDAESESFRPLYRYSLDRTARWEQEAAQSVPLQTITYRAGTTLADAGPIDAKELELLRREHEAFLASERQQRVRSWLGMTGCGLLAFLVIFGTASYLARYQGRPLTSPARQVVAALVLLTMLGLSRFTLLYTSFPPHATVGFQAFAAAMLAIVYTRGSVFAICAALALLVTLAPAQPPAFFVVLLAVSGTFVLGLADVRNRGKIVGVGVLAGLAALITTSAAGLAERQDFFFVLRDSLWGAAATLLAAFVIEGILPGIERAFRFSTSMTLLEWCDANKPLLRQMAAEAPGTYNHSLLVGALAEAAAEAIGANGLLCRAGAYYHDIGKISKAEYFVENQSPGESRHERLSPAMSLLIIVGHVKDGIAMAEEYGLPASLRPFIAEHHGTTVVEYFYHAARKLRKPDEAEVPESEYRYPGPKPQSRETAIVMLCDGVEGAVRAMSEPTPSRIEAVVSDVVRRRLLDGQFDECDLTFRELATVEKSLNKSLCALYHARIEYPSRAELEVEPERRAASESRHAS